MKQWSSSQDVDGQSIKAVDEAVILLQEIGEWGTAGPGCQWLWAGLTAGLAGVLDQREYLTTLGQRLAHISTRPTAGQGHRAGCHLPLPAPLLVVVGASPGTPSAAALQSRAEVDKVRTRCLHVALLFPFRPSAAFCPGWPPVAPAL